MIDLERDGWVVESPIIPVNDGGPVTLGSGTARVYVDTEARARQLVAELPSERTCRAVPLSEMPTPSRDSILRARREAGGILNSSLQQKEV